MKNKLIQSVHLTLLSATCLTCLSSHAAENITLDTKKVFTQVGTFTAPNSQYSYYYRDLNGDGTIDQLEINHTTGSFSTNGVGNMGFGYAGSDDALSYAILKDINHDGLEDIVGIGSKGVTSIINHGANFIGNDPILTKFKGNLKTSTDYLEIADIDNDGNDDIIFFYKGSIYFIEGNNGAFSTKWKKLSGTFNTSKYKHIKIIDVNYDGYPDLIGANTNTIDVAINSGLNGFQPTQSWLSDEAPLKQASFNIQVADITQDGYADLIAFYKDGSVKLAENLNGDKFNPYKQVASNFYGYMQQSIADVNHDGKADILGLASNKKGKHILMVALNAGETFSPTQFYYAPIKYFAEYDLKLKSYPAKSSKK
ncbi:FG-GAP repeat domain-containing protein [Zooshikella sp. RANM57]|uniref:FG-GAP repeat domain-containing protein n=1 Tax=Zooshikella sp. RANM57 TaxID=3425863 RepID=UPI003D6F94B3